MNVSVVEFWKNVWDSIHFGTDFRRQQKYCFVFCWCFSAAGSLSLRSSMELTECCPRCFHLHIAFCIAAASHMDGTKAPVAQRRSNWEVPTEFNMGEGLNGWSRAALWYKGRVRKDPEGPGGWLQVQLWSVAGNRHCQCTVRLKTGDMSSWG